MCVLPVNHHNLSDSSADQVICHPVTERALQSFADTSCLLFLSVRKSRHDNSLIHNYPYSPLCPICGGVLKSRIISFIVIKVHFTGLMHDGQCVCMTQGAQREGVLCLIWRRRAFRVYWKCVFTCVLGAPGECSQLNGLRTFRAWYEREQTQFPTGITVLRWFSCWVYCTCYCLTAGRQHNTVNRLSAGFPVDKLASAHPCSWAPGPWQRQCQVVCFQETAKSSTF